MGQENEFNPNSFNAVSASILRRLEEQDKNFSIFQTENRLRQREILEQALKTNGRVHILEAWQAFLRGALALLFLIFSTFGLLIWQAIKNDDNKTREIIRDVISHELLKSR